MHDGNIADSQMIDTPSSTSTAITTTDDLRQEALLILNQIVAEKDANKQKDLTYLFNVNQNKKTLAQITKYDDLLDKLTDQMMARVANRPDEITTKEIVDSLKAISDLKDRGIKQVMGAQDAPAPLIQINQQTNEVNVGANGPKLSKDSRDRVKNAVLSLLNGLGTTSIADQDIIESEVMEGNVNDN